MPAKPRQEALEPRGILLIECRCLVESISKTAMSKPCASNTGMTISDRERESHVM
jgi:hypothetical protein